MRKITFFFALLVTMITTAFAQDYTAVKVYQITAKDANRGALYAAAESTHLTHCGATYGNYHNRDVAVNESDANQQFAFIEYDGKVYLYSIGAQKFASKDGQFVVLTTLPAGFVTLADSDVDGYKLILFNGENRLNFSGGYAHGVVANYETPDDGNLLQVKEIGTFDATPVIAAIEAEKVALAQAREAFNAACEGAQTILNEAELTVSTEELPLQVTDANAAYYLWCNNPDPGEGPIAQLVDGVVQDGNFFHSSWRGGGEEPHYIEIDLGEGNELAAFSFNYTTRFAVANDYPDGIQVLGSNDKQTYAEVYNVTSGLPQTGGTLWTSPIVYSENAYRYYRFVVTAERTYWHMTEFDICTTNVSVAEKYQAVAKEVATLKGLCDSHATTDAYNAAMYTSAAEAISAAVEAVNAGVAVPVTFDIYALDDSMNPNPLEGTVSKLGYVAFAASDNNAVLAEAADAPKVSIFDTEKQSYVDEASSIMFGDLLGNGMQLVAVQFDGFATPGTYRVHAPAGAFTVNGKPSEEIISAEFTIPAPVVKVFEVESVTPADKEEVEAINEIKIKFTENITLQQNPATWSFYPVNLVDENNNVIELTTSDDINIWNLAVFTPAEPITAAGTYTLDLSQIKLDGGVCEGSYSWTVVEPVIPFAVAAVTPSEAVEKLETITIEFNKDIVVDWGTSNEGTGGTGTIAATDGTSTSGTGTATGGATAGGTGGATAGGTGAATGGTGGVSAIKVKDADGGNVTTIWTSQAVVEGNTITFKLESAIAKSGVYSVEIPAGCIKSVDGEEYAGETFTFTVDAAPALTSKTTVNVDNALSDITVEFDSEIEFAAESDVTVLNVYVQNTETVAATITVANNAVINGKVLTLTLDEVLAPEGTTKYTVEVPAGWIVKKGSDKAFTGKKLTYTVKVPFGVKNITPASGSTVESFDKIVVEYNAKVDFYPSALNFKLINTADNSEIALVAEKNDNIVTFTTEVEVSNGTYTLANLNNVVDNSSYLAPSILPEYTITVNAPVPFAVAAVTPSEAVEKLETITIEFNKDIVVDWGTSNEGTGGTGTIAATDGTSTSGTGTATGGATAGGTGGATAGGTGAATGGTGGVSAIKVKDADGGNVTTIWTSQAVVEGNTITFKLESAIAKSGVYSVEIPAGCIKSVDGEEYAGETFTFTVDAAPALTSKTTVNVDNALSDITVEFDSEIEFAAESDVTVLNVYVQNTETVAATITVANNAVINGKVLTLTLDEVLAPEGTTKYTVEVPAGWIVKKGSDKAFTGKKLTYTVKVPFGVKNITPASGSTVESFDKIVVEYNAKVDFYPSALNFKLINTADNSEIALVAEKNDNIVTFTTEVEVSNGTYTLANLNNVVDNSSYLAPSILPEYTITVNAPVVELASLELASSEKNPNNNAKKLQGVKLNFNEAVKKYTTEATGDYGYIRDAEGNEVAKLTKVMGANGTATYATPYATPAIEMGGTYTIVVNSGVFLSADGTKEYKGGEFEFVVEATEPYFYPLAEEGFCYNETFERVEDFKEFTITVKYAKEVVLDAEKKVRMTCGENVYEAVVTLKEVNATTKDIKVAFDGEFAEGRYTIDVPEGLFTVDGVANAEFAKSTFTYRKPQLEITRDFDTWESYLDQVWYMPKGAIITIANAESVEVDETKVATIAVGESVYNSTLNWYYDDWSSAYYIELTFEDFFAEGFEFVKGDYTFTLPAGLYTVNGVANEEAVKAYTYGDPIIEEFNVTEVLPANGSKVEALDAISISFSNGAKVDMLPVVCGEKSYMFVYNQGIYVAVDNLMSYEPITITEPGTYTLDLSEVEGLTGNKVFSWTIEEAVVAPTLNETAVFDFTYNAWGIQEGLDPVSFAGTKTAGDYTDGINTIHIDPTANKGQFYYENGYLRIQKPGSKIVLPAFDFAVEKIEVVGHPSATSYPNVDMNVYVGDAAVSTACTGSTETYTYEIAADNQAAGNVYELVIGSNGGGYSSVMYITYIKVYPENKLEAPVIDLASGVYVGEQTVNAHSATTEIEGVTDVTYYYTTDGNEPTTEDKESTDGNITITNSCTLKVIVEFTLGDKTYVSASTSAEYIITEEATYHRAVAVEAGNYFLVADGKVSAPIEGTTLPAVEVTVEGNDVTAPVYYAITLEETNGGYYIKDVNGKYIYNGSTTPHKLSSGTSAPMDAWTIEIADDENSTATIKCNGYVLALNKGVFCTVDPNGTDVPVMPTLYGTYVTGINEAVVNGEAIESIYDLTGRRVEKITNSGIYIVNGKKVLVK